jgi:hypothetical protein
MCSHCPPAASRRRGLSPSNPPARELGCQALAYVYFEDEPGRRSVAKLLTKDEARPLRSGFEGGQDCKSRFHSSRPVLMN